MATLYNNAQKKALTTLSRAKSYLDISGDKKDTLLTILINQATDFIETECKRRFLRQTYTDEVYNGSGSESLVLKQAPVASVTTLQVNTSGDSSAAWQTINSTNYFWDADGIIRLNSPVSGFLDQDAGSFLPYPQKYRATYAAGYLINFDQENDPAQHTLPGDIEMACLLLLSDKLNTRKSQGLSSAKVGEVSMTFRALAAKNEEVLEILGRFKFASL